MKRKIRPGELIVLLEVPNAIANSGAKTSPNFNQRR